MLGKGLRCKLCLMFGGIILLSGLQMASAAAASGTNILSAVPAEAWVAIEIKDLSKTSKAIDDYATKLGVEPPAIQRQISRKLGISGQLEADKPMVLVVMNKQMYGAQPVAVIVSVKEYDNFATNLKAKATETPGLMKGENEEIGQVYFTKKGPYVVMGPTEAIVNAVVSSKKGYAAAMDAEALKLQGNSDVYLRGNLQALGQVAKPMLMGIGAMMQMSGMGMGMEGMGGEGTATQEGQNPQMQAQMQAMGTMITAVVGLIDELNALDVGLKFNPEMIQVSKILSFKPGMEIANVLALQKETSQSLLKGLPGTGFAVAAGWQWQPKVTKFGESMMQINPGFTDPADIEKYRKLQKESWEIANGSSFKIDTRPIVAGEPMVVLYSVIETKNSKKYLDIMRESLELQKKIKVQPKPGQTVQFDYKYEPGIATVDSVVVDQYTMNLGKFLNVPGMSGTDLDQIKGVFTALLGDPTGNVKIKVAAVNDKLVAIAMGAGPEEMKQFINVAKSGTAPISTNEQVIQTTKLLPRERFLEGYMDLGKIINGVMAVAMKVKSMGLDGANVPESLPAIQTPLVGFTGTIEGSAFKTDAVIPFEVIKQIANLQNMAPATKPATGPAGMNSPLTPQ